MGDVVATWEQSQPELFGTPVEIVLAKIVTFQPNSVTLRRLPRFLLIASSLTTTKLKNGRFCRFLARSEFGRMPKAGFSQRIARGILTKIRETN